MRDLHRRFLEQQAVIRIQHISPEASSIVIRRNLNNMIRIRTLTWREITEEPQIVQVARRLPDSAEDSAGLSDILQRQHHAFPKRRRNPFERLNGGVGCRGRFTEQPTELRAIHPSAILEVV